MYEPRQRAAFRIPVKSVSFKSFDYRRHRACAIARLVELYTTYTTILRQLERCQVCQSIDIKHYYIYMYVIILFSKYVRSVVLMAYNMTNN